MAAKKPSPKASELADPEIRPAPKVGRKAPAFKLPAHDGTEVALKDLKGKTVVLYFYPKDSTPGCTVEACGFRDLYDELQDMGAVVLGVSRDSLKRHQNFATKQSLNFPLLSDPEGKVISAYGSWGPKKFMGREFDGILRTTVIIDAEGKIAKVYPKVATKTHAATVLADLKELLQA